jgi:hypothetical protein
MCKRYSLSYILRKIKGTVVPVQGCDRSVGVQEFGVPRFLDNQHMKMVKLWVLPTGRLYFQQIFQVFVYVEVQSTPEQLTAWRIMSMKISRNNIGNPTRDLPACSWVPLNVTFMVHFVTSLAFGTLRWKETSDEGYSFFSRRHKLYGKMYLKLDFKN